jgi:hypothetical protein
MKHYLLFLLCGAYVLSTFAQDKAGAEPISLGKLFLTPEKRQALERQRQFNLRESESSEAETLQLNGIVQRSSGYNSIWLNQRVQSGNETGLQVQRVSPNTAKVSPKNEAATQLKVGESINRSTRERKDVVAPGAVHVDKQR